MTDDIVDDTSGIERRVTETIPASLAEVRIDRVVSLIADVSRNAAATLIDTGAVTLDGEVVAAGKEKVREGQTITVDISKAVGPELPTGDPSVVLDVVYRDDDVIVVNKPAGLVVHPGAGNKSGTMVNHLLAAFPEIATVGDPMRPGIVHRLDAGTTDSSPSHARNRPMSRSSSNSRCAASPACIQWWCVGFRRRSTV